MGSLSIFSWLVNYVNRWNDYSIQNK